MTISSFQHNTQFKHMFIIWDPGVNVKSRTCSVCSVIVLNYNSTKRNCINVLKECIAIFALLFSGYRLKKAVKPKKNI